MQCHAMKDLIMNPVNSGVFVLHTIMLCLIGATCRVHNAQPVSTDAGSGYQVGFLILNLVYCLFSHELKLVHLTPNKRAGGVNTFD